MLFRPRQARVSLSAAWRPQTRFMIARAVCFVACPSSKLVIEGVMSSQRAMAVQQSIDKNADTRNFSSKRSIFSNLKKGLEYHNHAHVSYLFV
jgi:hypothetical protein